MFSLILAGILIWFEVSSGGETLESLIPKDIPRGWALMEGPQAYTKKTLFKHINGQAELFFKYGFQKSVFGIYQDKKNRENQIEFLSTEGAPRYMIYNFCFVPPGRSGIKKSNKIAERRAILPGFGQSCPNERPIKSAKILMGYVHNRYHVHRLPWGVVLLHW
jgi:hypothetical protein